MRRLIGLCALVVAVALAVAPAFAEVQNVKVSGDIDVKAISHDNFDLKRKQLNLAPVSPGSVDGVTNDDDASVFLQTTRVRVDADLTDNVSTTVRLINQRFWDTDTDPTNNIDLDWGYVTLKELVYSPLTVTVGRQPLSFGTQFIVGAGFLADPNVMFASANIGQGVHGSNFQEFSEYNAYDAIRATLDFTPLVVDAIYAKINETGVTSDDQTLYGVNLNWKGVPVDRINGEAELYWFLKDDEGFASTNIHDNTRAWDRNTVHTVGGRVAGEPVSNLHLNGEFAYQMGELEDASTVAAGYLERDRQAWALNVSGNYAWATVPWTPATGVGYVHYSGEKAGGSSQTDDFGAWDPMYRGSFTTYIQDFLAGTDAGSLYTTVDPNDTAAPTNRQILYADVAAKPLEDLSVFLRYSHIWFDETPVAGRSDEAGDEVDVKVAYDYTEDVQFAAVGAWFFPGGYYDDNPNTSTRADATAWEVLGGVSVDF